MLPSLVSHELSESVSRFLRSAFPIATPWFQQGVDGHAHPHAIIDSLITEPGAIFKGPWLDIRLPFRLAEQGELPLRHIKLSYVPYRHQLAAFQRLAGDSPLSTIVATGTGSGKTECFMLPLLDDALERRERGIKAIVIYPMNALAGDQARRFAEEVSRLDTRLTVGLFVGNDGNAGETTMASNHVITCHKTLRKSPPDILLTNYKMLDFLLIRPKDRELWRFNTPGMLRYLVVDELHTFDGAQGTDLACLIRRLRDRLEAGPELACVGTSATIGTDSTDALVHYASEVFATPFDDHSIILEDRLAPDEYLGDAGAGKPGVDCFHWPDAEDPRLDASRYDQAAEYIFHQARLWFPELPLQQFAGLQSSQPRQQAEAAVALGEQLHRHEAFHSLIRACNTLTDTSALAADWSSRFSLGTPEQAARLLASLTSLVAAARLWRQPDDVDPRKWTQPFLFVRQQLWLRELRRLVCSVPGDDAPARLWFSDDLQNPEKPLHLPLLHCRECHFAAWGAMQRRGDSHLNADLQEFYQGWFSNSSQALLLVPLTSDQPGEGAVMQLCTDCLRLQATGGGIACSECKGSGLRRVWVPNITRNTQRGGVNRVECHHDCPECGARDSLAVMGYRAATLASVMTGKLFHTPYNDDFKLIAFSDSVQDAAHRAGFLGANTWRQVVRQAMIVWLQEQPADQPLKDMAELLPAYWRARVNHDASFCGIFLPPNLAWHPDYRSLTETGKLPPGSKLPDLVARRLAWECVAEFGRRSRIGRSLERTGVAAIALDSRSLNRDVSALIARLREEIEPLQVLQDTTLQRFVLGFLEHLRHVGAIYDPVLDGYLNNRGKEFLINQLPWMPGFGRSQRPPAAATLTYLSSNFETLVHNQRDTWAINWLKKVLGGEHVFIAAEARAIFSLMLSGLTRAGWLVERTTGDASLWLLDPARLYVSTSVAQLRCDSCRHVLPAAYSSRMLYEQMDCLRQGCHGRYHQMPLLQTVPRALAQPPRRLVPAEHTGLLRREDREAVERSFMKGDKPWDINLLSATPTLEMGIDIGELSSVLLCSVPPAQANYLQRIGRAGRRDGNALAVTIANGQNHDLYFYADPMEMMAGSVNTPGVFLKAIAVLERQLLAYCFDRWAASGIDESAIPDKFGKVLDAIQYGHQDQFPYTLFNFVHVERGSLLAGFFALFPELDEDSGKYLDAVLRDTGERSFSLRLVERLQRLVEERQSLSRRVDQLKAELSQLEKLPRDEVVEQQIDEVTRERNALFALLSHIRGQQVLNFFTDEGLLPNYAFPEEGVTLRSVILRRLSAKEQLDAAKAAKDAYKFDRPAQSALSELAPESVFYAISHQMEIEQVDLKLSDVEQWRFCDRCSYTEKVDSGDQHSACPKCGSPQWADAGQKHTVLKLRQVYATVDDRHDRIGDDSENREPVFFNREMLVSIPPDGHQGGFRLDSEQLPFGFEFLRRADFREINFGPVGGDTNHFSVAGREMPRKGFRICRHCGKVQKERFRRHEQPHAWGCPFRKNPEQASEGDFLNSLYLYRDLQSEAIRILLPLSEVAYSDEKLHSFIAALNLGLRAYFRGDVHHLEVTDMREPATAESGERVYLVIYDRIPGGTGYLKELMRSPDNLMDMLQLALDRLNHCECVDDEHRDGCYRCILAYRHSRNMATISRRGAAELLGSILSLRNQLKPVDSLSSISTNVLIESKLEQRFIDALAALPGARMTRTLVNGKSGSLLTLPGADGAPASWYVEHQVRVGPQTGVPVMTDIDVVLRPAREEDARRFRPIAVYLDGIQYHHNIVADDVIKRMGLLLSGQYWVYSLNWDDLPEPGKLVKGNDPDIMRYDGPEPSMSVIWDRLAEPFGWRSASEQQAPNGWGSLAWLESVLRDPDLPAGAATQRALYRGVTLLSPRAVRDTALRQKVGYELRENAPEWVIDRLAPDNEAQVPGGLMDAFENSPRGIEVSVSLPLDGIRASTPQPLQDGLSIHLCFDDRQSLLDEGFKNNWRAFWHAANQLQFLPGFSMATRKAVSTGQLDQLWSAWQMLCQVQTPEQGDNSAWPAVFSLSVLPVEQLQALMALGVPEPEVGLDISDDAGAVLLGGDSVELCWPDQKVAVVMESTDAPEGWTLLLADNQLIDRIEKLKQAGAW